MGRWGLGVVMLAIVGCGGTETASSTGTTPPPDEPCPPPNQLVGDDCRPPVVEDDGCPAGTVTQPDETCLPAGVLPELCAEGFVHDGEVACEPILPAAPCPVGQMAIPGDTTCRPVMDCGRAPWGDIPVDATTLYVDAAYAGGTSDGSATQPFTTIAEAIVAAPDGALVAVAAGTYVEDIVLTKPLRLWGRCPDEVAVVGAGVEQAALLVEEADGTEVHGLALSGPNALGVAVTGSLDVVVDRLWIHDLPGVGVIVQDDYGPTSAALTGLLVENDGWVGVLVGGARATMTGLAVRDTQPRPSDQLLGQGISIQPSPSSAALPEVTVSGSVIERNHASGIHVSGGEVEIEGVVVRDTLPQASDDDDGRGIAVNNGEGLPTFARITGSLVARNHDHGVAIVGADAVLEGLVVRDTKPRASDQEVGIGINARPGSSDAPLGVVSVRHSLIERNHTIGVLTRQPTTLEGLVVRDTQPQPSDERHGLGLQIVFEPSLGTADLSGSLFERNHSIGILVFATATLNDVHVRDTHPQISDGNFGNGIHAQSMPDTLAPSVLTVDGALLEDNSYLGLAVLGSTATLTNVDVRGTQAQPSRAIFGDGIVFISADGKASGEVTRCRASGSARAGLVNFGADVALKDVSLTCNAFDLVGESFEEESFAFEDLGGNTCGCGDEVDVCKAVSAGLDPPALPAGTM